METITYKTAAGEKVSITGFGVFEKVHRSARMVRNPRTGERKTAKTTAVRVPRRLGPEGLRLRGQEGAQGDAKKAAPPRAAPRTPRASKTAVARQEGRCEACCQEGHDDGEEDCWPGASEPQLVSTAQDATATALTRGRQPPRREGAGRAGRVEVRREGISR